jgi:hypothetical protein
MNNHISYGHIFKPEEIAQKSENVSSEIQYSFWNFSTMIYVFAALSIVLLLCLLFCVNKCLSLKEKEVIKFSCQKNKDGWYSNNLMVTEKKMAGECGITEKDFIVVWS